jgi:hypothetical protein
MLFKLRADKTPTMLNTKGKFLKIEGINSLSIPELFFDIVRIEFDQNTVPEPMNECFKKYPENRLPIINKIKE